MSRGRRIAVVTSVGVHVALLLIVSRVEVARPIRQVDTLRFDLLVRPPVAAPVPKPSPASGISPTRRAPSLRRQPGAESLAARPPAVTEGLPTAPILEPTPPPTPALPAPTKVDLFAHEALSRAAERGVELPQVGTGRKTDFGRLPGEAAGEHAASEGERVAARVVGVTIDSDARQRVQAGLVDPSYTKMGRAFLDAWDPDRALPETSAELWVKRRAQNAIVSTRLWQEAGANYGRTGSAVAPGETLEKTKDVRPEAALGLGTDGRKQSATFRQYMSGKFNSGRSAHVLVDEDEERVRVSLVQSSGDIDLDRAALEDIRSALIRMRSEKPELKRKRKSVWMMRLLILINPPVPVVGVSFDEVIQRPHLELPLDRHLFKHVELEAVYDDDTRLASPDAGPP